MDTNGSNIRFIPLTRGKYAVVDREDYEYLSQWKWYCSTRGYARRAEYPNGKQRFIHLHRIVAFTPEEMEVDHINGDTLDNRKSNLRNCFHYQNSYNKKLSKKNTSGYKGVSWYPKYQKWVAQIAYKRKGYTLGYFERKEEAALAYNIAAKKYFGEFARINQAKGGT